MHSDCLLPFDNNCFLPDLQKKAMKEVIITLTVLLCYDGLKWLFCFRSKADRQNERKIAAVKADLSVIQKTVGDRLPNQQKTKAVLDAWNRTKNPSEK